MNNKSVLIIFGVVLLIIIGAYLAFAGANTPQESQALTPTAMPKNQADSTPAMQIDKNKSYSAVIKTTVGDITLSLNANETPITVNNFVYLSRKGFYNNTIFHRIIKGFMIQGGDPTGTGAGGPGYRFADEPFAGDYNRGVIAMANAGPNTNGSQFFIMQEDDSKLPKNYVIFGQVTAGIEVVDLIANAPVVANSMGEPSKPVSPVRITSVKIQEQ